MSEPNRLGHGGRLRFLAKDAAVYGIGGALTKLLSLITFPLLARYFSVQDFGLIDLLNTAVLLLSVCWRLVLTPPSRASSTKTKRLTTAAKS